MHIELLDLHFQGVPHAIASYLVRGPDGTVLVETGPGSTLPTLVAHLQQRGLQPGDLAAAIVTHIHLDHAGAAGWLAQQGVPLYVHHVGAPHLIDPSRLWSSASRIYGAQMEALWGEIVPAPAAQVIPLVDGAAVHAAGLTFIALDTPGHATHHHVIRLENVAFTGDIAGVHMPGTTWVDIPAPPPEFDLERWRTSIARLRAEDVSCLYPTHFGPVTHVDRHLDMLSASLEAVAAFVRVRMEEDLSREDLVAAYVSWLRTLASGLGVPGGVFDQYALANPHFMSVDGLTRYWRKRRSAP